MFVRKAGAQKVAQPLETRHEKAFAVAAQIA